MSMLDAVFDRKRNRIARILECHGFSLERGDYGEDIYVRDGQEVILREKDVRYISGGTHIDSKYGKQADDFFYMTIGELPSWKCYLSLANKRVKNIIHDIREAA